MEAFQNPDDDTIRRLLERVRRALAKGAGALWLQLDCIDESGARRAREAACRSSWTAA